MLKQDLQNLPIIDADDKLVLLAEIHGLIESSGYNIVEENLSKPWGGYFRFDGADADKFVAEFFPGLSAEEARLGNPNAELSPKILIVSPGQRLSLQYHGRRAERWAFLTEGSYVKSTEDDPSEVYTAEAGYIVQFACGERHRLIGASDDFTLVAEIWQHTEVGSPSNEDDIVRIEDDYSR